MVDSNLISDFILKPLMINNISSNNSNFFKEKTVLVANKSNLSIKKIKKIKSTNVIDYIYRCLIPQNSVKKQNKFDDIASSVNSGNCILFIDTLNVAFDVDVKGFKQRSVDSPNNEVVIKGPQEAFVENLRTNTSLLRRIINSEKLVIENIDVGNITKTKCAICYLENIANNNLVAEVKYRINNLDVDSIISSRSA